MLLDNIKTDLSKVIGTWFGVGFAPKASGTIATLVIALIWFLVPEYYFYNSTENEIFYDRFLYLFIALFALSWVSVRICNICEKAYGDDSSKIVIDEVVGYMFAVLFLPKTTMVVLYAFILFRIFDIGKPFGIKRLERFKNGYGVMLDDIAAGIGANIVLQFIYLVKPSFFYFI